MHRNYKKVKSFALTISVAAAMSGIALAQNATGQDQSNASVSQNSSNTNNSNSMMSQAQQQLKQQGFYTGNVDGIFGPKTRMAIRRYQQSKNLNQSGALDQATLSSLGLSGSNTGEAARSADQSSTNGNNAPGENSSGKISSDRVRDAQQKLARDGYYNGKVDGMMNDGTRSAIRQYQKDNNLPVTGHLNRETAKSMGINTSQGNFEDNNNGQSPLEQLGKGVAEGAQTPHNQNSNSQNNNSNSQRQQQH